MLSSGKLWPQATPSSWRESSADHRLETWTWWEGGTGQGCSPCAGITLGQTVAAVGSGVCQLSQSDYAHCSQVCPEVGAGGDSSGRNMDAPLEELQPPNTEGPMQQVLPDRQATETMEAAGLPTGPLGLKRPLPGQPSDHSYALLDLDTLKKKLFLTLKENKRLRKRLKAQRLLLLRTCGRLRAYRGGPRGQRGPRAEAAQGS